MNSFKNFFLRLSSQISLQEKINFARHLSVTTKSGLPLLEALKLIRKQASSKRFAKVIEGLINAINNGQSMFQALGRYGYIFDDFFINLVKVGETSGNLSETLIHLAVELKKQREVSRRVKAALVYPTVILIVTVSVTLFLTLFIFPKILPIFVSLGVQLPFTTQLVMKLLTFLGKYGFHLLGGIIGFVILIELMLAIKKIHFLFDKLILTLPFVSGVMVHMTMTNFTRSLSVLLKSGMNIVEALEVSKGTFHNKYYRGEIDKIIDSVKRGESIASYLADKPKLFPPMLVGMIEVGESTGNLEQNLLYLSDYYESEVDEVVKNLTTILEPLLLLVMGLMVGFIALAIITPIYKVTQGIKLG